VSEPCELTAVEARRLIGARRLSPVELMQSCLRRIDRVNPKINAVVTLDAEAALAAARSAEADVMAGRPLARLHGLPVLIKDNRATRGMRTTYGSLIYRDNVPDADDPGVARLRAAGGIITGKTNLPEFGAGANTVNRVFGATGNPFDPDKTAAGSSGGSAAALATGMAPLASGSDYGGSLRTPAAFCGVVGFRPSLGVVPSTGSPSLLSPWGVEGPMGRTVADVHLFLGAQVGHDARDPFSRPEAAGLTGPLQPADLSAVRAAFSADLGAAPVAGTIRSLFAQRAAALAPLFAASEEAAPDFGPIHEVFEITRGLAFLSAHHERLKHHRELLDRNVIDNTERGLAYTAADVAWAHNEQAALYRRTLAFFGDHDILIAPGASVSPFPHARLFVEEIDGEPMPTYMRWLALSYMPTLAFCCAAVLPAGRDGEGMPFGLQVIGPAGADRRVLSVALSLEAALAGEPSTARPVPDIAGLSR